MVATKPDVNRYRNTEVMPRPHQDYAWDTQTLRIDTE
jgi:hypothetical protein